MHPTNQVFKDQIASMLIVAQNNNEQFKEIKAGELHRLIGEYPKADHRMPMCCKAMRDLMVDGDIIIKEPLKGNGATFTVRYKLPRKSTK